jgi:hypothetical protein
MTVEHAAYFGIIYELATRKPNLAFEQIFKEVFPKGMPAHPDPCGLKGKYRTAYDMAR